MKMCYVLLVGSELTTSKISKEPDFRTKYQIERRHPSKKCWMAVSTVMSLVEIVFFQSYYLVNNIIYCLLVSEESI